MAKRCVNCPLYERGTQTVFGEGAATARVMLVGEQPGDQEDLAGRPFVGPAGRLLARALDRAGIRREDAYVTNVVKHFKWVPRGKRRMHQKPSAREIDACSGWIEAELRIVRPDVLVCLGATAAMALLGKDFRVTRDRGRFVPSELAPRVVATAHPSSVLRARTHEERESAFEALVADLVVAARALAEPPARRSHARRSEELEHAESRQRLDLELETEANVGSARGPKRGARSVQRRVGVH
jgi:DNA polymerase